MLQSFRFANHRSFADEQQLNLTPAYTQPESRVTVPVVGIFGANASGKSNALDALSSMRRLVLQSDKAVEPGLPSSLTREPFLLDPEIAVSPSRYVVDLSLDGVRHTYGYTIDDERIVEEWLYHYPFKKKRRVFERDGDSFAWGEETRKGSDLERISAITAPAALFVSTAARFAQAQSGGGHQPLHDVYKWFMRAITRDRPGLNAGNLLSLGSRWAAETNERRASIIELLKAADVGIVDVLLLEEPAHDGLGALVGRDPIGAPLVEPSSPRRSLQFAHRGPSGQVLLGLLDESTGTQQLFELAMDATTVLGLGSTLTIDEIDASLHPMLTAKLIDLFQSPRTNPLGSQLIFTSHDATLLGAFDTEEILARDEIWFTEKAKDGTSTLYPLTDFKPRREGENRQRRYLNGNYGGVPELSWAPFERAVAAREAASEDAQE